jgi:NO-binding membrane sensor protein with MHYT domain
MKPAHYVAMAAFGFIGSVLARTACAYVDPEWLAGLLGGMYAAFVACCFIQITVKP